MSWAKLERKAMSDKSRPRPNQRMTAPLVCPVCIAPLVVRTRTLFNIRTKTMPRRQYICVRCKISVALHRARDIDPEKTEA